MTYNDCLRFKKAGAVLALPLNDINELRKSYTVNSAPTVVNTARGRVIDFDGTDDSIVIGNIQKDIKTVAFWVNSDTTTEQYVDLDGGTSYIDSSSGTVQANNFTSPTIYVDGSVSSTITADTFHLIVVTTDTGITASNVQLATDNVNFGDCSLQNVLMFDRVLSAQEVSDLYNGTTFDYDKNIVSKWDMSEINPQDVGWQGNGNDGTGTSITDSDIVDGYNGRSKAIQFDGSNDYVDSVTLDITDYDKISILAMVKVDSSTNSNGRLVSIKHSGSDDIRLLIDSSNQFSFTIDDGTAYAATITEAINDETWHFLAGVFDGSNVKAYLDGANEKITGSASFDFSTADGALGISAFSGGTFLYKGAISKVILCNNQLTQIQLKDIYQRLIEGRI